MQDSLKIIGRTGSVTVKTVYDHIHEMTIDELAEQLCKWLWWSPTKEEMLEELQKEYQEQDIQDRIICKGEWQ